MKTSRLNIDPTVAAIEEQWRGGAESWTESNE
jgi:hypothetical protein